MKRLLPIFLLSASIACAQISPNVLSLLTQQVAKAENANTQKNILRGMNAGLQGRTGLQAPPEWDGVAEKLSQSSDGEVRELALSIGVIFGTKKAFDGMRKTAADLQATPAARQKALEALIAGKDAETAPILRGLLAQAGPLRKIAIRGLASYAADDTADLLLANYAKFDQEEKRDALSTIASRPAWARKLVPALEQQTVPRADYSATLVRSLRAFKDADIDAVLDKNFGKLSGTTDKQADITAIKKWLTADFIKTGNATHGREVFSRTCAVCHKLFDAGADIGPELTGANRTDIDYLLQNIVDPNAIIGADYQLQMIELKDGRVLAGMVRGQNANTLTVRTLTETMTIPVGDVKSRTISPTSMMPEGLLLALPHDDARDLFRYLGSPKQVPLP